MKTMLGKISVLLVIVVFLEIGLTIFLKTPGEIKELNECLKRKADVIYFGDSTISNSAKDDSDKRSIVSMLQDQLPQLKICCIQGSSYNMDVYLSFCRYILKQKYRPKVLIIPINMRSFSPEWDMRPEYQFEKLKVFLDGSIFLKILYRPLSVLKCNLYGVRQDQFKNTPVFNGDMPVGRVKDFEQSIYGGCKDYSAAGARKVFLYLYMYSLKERHRKIQSMLGIAKIMKQSGTKVIFYITPIDYETGEKYLPAQFLKRLDSNTRLIASLLSIEGVDLLDISKGLGAASFNYPFPCISEHMNESGRRYVAQRLADEIEKISCF
ncbi:MAG: hypothetical protein WC522_06095 [Candidatus Omnitrophota bacterium]